MNQPPIFPPMETLVQGLDPLFLVIALAFVMLDVISGYIKAFATKSLDSSIMRQGLWHKIAIILALTLAAMIDMAANGGMDLGFEVPIFDAACVYVALMEITSIVENITKINPDLSGTKLFNLFNEKKDDGE